jgi:pyruvate-formate lyase
MSIALTTQPPVANAALTEVDAQAVITALTSVATLPAGKVAGDVVSLNVTIQPSGAGVLNVRFK